METHTNYHKSSVALMCMALYRRNKMTSSYSKKHTIIARCLFWALAELGRICQAVCSSVVPSLIAREKIQPTRKNKYRTWVFFNKEVRAFFRFLSRLSGDRDPLAHWFHSWTAILSQGHPNSSSAGSHELAELALVRGSVQPTQQCLTRDECSLLLPGPPSLALVTSRLNYRNVQRKGLPLKSNTELQQGPNAAVFL